MSRSNDDNDSFSDSDEEDFRPYKIRRDKVPSSYKKILKYYYNPDKSKHNRHFN